MNTSRFFSGAVFKSAILLGIFQLLSRIFGLWREHLLADRFGALNGSGIFSLDTYYAAFRLPDLIFSLLILGTISTALVPIFVEYLQRDDVEEGWRYANSLISVLAVLMISLAAGIFFFAPWLMKLIAPGFNSEQLKIAVDLTRIMLLSPFLFGISSVFQSIQNAFQTFFYYSLAPIFYNLGIIFGIIFWTERNGVYGVAYGVVLGAFLHVLIQVPKVVSLGYRFRPIWDLKRRDLKETLGIVIPRIIGLSSQQIVLVVEIVIASTLFSGAIALLNFALNLESLPMGIVGISFSIAVFSLLSRHAAEKDFEKFAATLEKTFMSMLVLIAPAAFGLFLFRSEVVNAVLKSGQFSLNDASITADLLGLYMFGLMAQSLIPLLARAFYSFKDSKTPVVISVLSMMTAVSLSLVGVFMLGLGLQGIVIADVIAANVNLILLWIFLYKRIGMGFFDISRGAAIFFACLIMMAAVLFLKSWYVGFFGQPVLFWQFVAEISLVGGAGAGIYFWALVILSGFKKKMHDIF